MATEAADAEDAEPEIDKEGGRQHNGKTHSFHSIREMKKTGDIRDTEDSEHPVPVYPPPEGMTPEGSMS
jgi:hypothetical protein